jgi:hypothetical protein
LSSIRTHDDCFLQKSVLNFINIDKDEEENSSTAGLKVHTESTAQAQQQKTTEVHFLRMGVTAQIQPQKRN